MIPTLTRTPATASSRDCSSGYRRSEMQTLSTAGVIAHHKCHDLTVQQQCHIMENVTLNQKEQARLQILNSLLADHMTVDQAATLMGVSTRHT